ncbi:MAG: MFS transporter, partial [Frankiaceae bacterium]|nr:MFS transporter [Frankiaceae bacterium]
MGEPSGRLRALVALCVTVTVSYGTLYYAFPVLLSDMAADTGWSRTAITAMFSLGSLAGAAAGVPVGRLVGRRGPRLAMSAASILGAGALLIVASAPSFPVLAAGWLLAGASTAGLYYPPAFAALTVWYRERRVRALTALTLVAGLSSTIFAPSTALLAGHLSWRGVYAVLAGVLLAVTLPLHALALRVRWPAADRTRARHRDRPVLRSRRFILLSWSTAAANLASFAALVQLVPLLTGRGLSATGAAWALGLGGAGQVAGRMLYPPLGRIGAPARTVAVFGALGSMLALLAIVPGPAAVLIALSVLAGAVRGMFTLVQATAVSDRWGIEAYAALNGVYNLPISAASALAPVFGAALGVALGGDPRLFAALALIAGAAAAPAAWGDRAAAGQRRPRGAGTRRIVGEHHAEGRGGGEHQAEGRGGGEHQAEGRGGGEHHAEGRAGREH